MTNAIGQYTVRTKDGDRYPVFGRSSGTEFWAGYGCCGNQTRYGHGNAKTEKEANDMAAKKLIAAHAKHIKEGLTVSEIEWGDGFRPEERVPVQVTAAPAEAAEAPRSRKSRARTKTVTSEA